MDCLVQNTGVKFIDTKTLVFAQTARVGGIAFLAVYAVGKLNGKFALWAGLLDAATGFSAPFAAHYLTPPRTAKQRGLLMAWMAVGILDFVAAIPLASRVRASDPASMDAITIPPLSMITTYFVPLALMDYFILAVQLWRQRLGTFDEEGGTSQKNHKSEYQASAIYQ